MLVYAWTVGFERPSIEVARALLVLDRGPLRRDGRGLVVRLATPAVTDADDRLRRFAAMAQESIGEFGAPVANAPK
jgi:hypothetical protein